MNLGFLPLLLEGGAVDGTATVTGIAVLAAVGTVQATGAANVAQVGIAASAAVGTSVATGAANVSAVGISATAAVGQVQASGDAVPAEGASGGGGYLPASTVRARVRVVGVSARTRVGVVKARGEAGPLVDLVAEEEEFEEMVVLGLLDDLVDDDEAA